MRFVVSRRRSLLRSRVGCGSGRSACAVAAALRRAETPAAGAAPAAHDRRATPGADARGEGPAAAPAKEPVITTMPMDVPSGTELVLTLETPVSSETAKPDQPVRATVAKPVVVAGMEVIPHGATRDRRRRLGRAIGQGEGTRIDRAALQRSDGDEHAVSHQHRAHRARGRGDEGRGREEDRHRRRRGHGDRRDRRRRERRGDRRRRRRRRRHWRGARDARQGSDDSRRRDAADGDYGDGAESSCRCRACRAVARSRDGGVA